MCIESDCTYQAILRDVVQGMRFLHSANPPIVHGNLKVKQTELYFTDKERDELD